MKSNYKQEQRMFSWNFQFLIPSGELLLGAMCCILFLLTASCGKEAKDAPVEPIVNQGTPAPETPLVFEPNQGFLSAQGVFRARLKSWERGPQVTKNDGTRNDFTIELALNSGRKADTVEVILVEPYMKIHRHGVPPPYQPTLTIEGNIIKGTNMGFIMSGPWELKVQARINGKEDTVEVLVDVP